MFILDQQTGETQPVEVEILVGWDGAVWDAFPGGTLRLMAECPWLWE